MMQDAQQLSDAGKYAEAARTEVRGLLVSRNTPKVPSVPEANFYGGYAHYLAGESRGGADRFPARDRREEPAAELAQIVELSLSLTPQVMAAKAAKMQPEDQRRKTTLEDAVKRFDAYLAKYPNSDEAESATYSKATALFQLSRFDEAVAALRGNITKFARSPTVQDSQYLLALTLAAVASNARLQSHRAGPGGRRAV